MDDHEKNKPTTLASPTQLTHAPLTQLTRAPLAELTHAPLAQLTHAPLAQRIRAPSEQLTRAPLTQLTRAPLTQWLYLISPPRFDPEILSRRLAAALDDIGPGVIAMFQLRIKTGILADVTVAHRALAPILRAHNIPLIINDSVAQALAADGAHLGRSDGSMAMARQQLGVDHILGITCHNSLDWALEAARNGADYVAFGAFFSSTTKVPDYWCQPDLLRRWRQKGSIPAVAIGGIEARHVASLRAAGADYIAAGGAIWKHPGGIAAALQQWNRALSDNPIAPMSSELDENEPK